MMTAVILTEELKGDDSIHTLKVALTLIVMVFNCLIKIEEFKWQETRKANFLTTCLIKLIKMTQF